MRVSVFCLCSFLLAGCASQRLTSVASANSVPSPASRSQPRRGLEIRHMYLFAPGKTPVKIVMLDDGTTSQDRSWVAPHAEQ